MLKFLAEHSPNRFNILELRDKLNLPESSISSSLSALDKIKIVKGKFKFYCLGERFAKEIYNKLDNISKNL